VKWKAEGTAGKKPEYRKQMEGCENSRQNSQRTGENAAVFV
jgi:hypothetical protein